MSNPGYQAVIGGLLRMHELAIGGQEESAEAEAVRESMSEPWEQLAGTERERVTGLSRDLYNISDAADRPPQSMSPELQAKLNDAYEARERGEWDLALQLLRELRTHMSAALLSYLRGTIWRDAGEMQVAAVFFENACRLAPEERGFQAAFLDILRTVDPDRAAEMASLAAGSLSVST